MAEISRGEIQDLLIKFASTSPQYREALVKDPKLVLSRQLNTEIPTWLKVKAVQDSADTIHVVVPYVPREGEELSDSALEQVAGGKDNDKQNTYTCNNTNGVGTRIEVNMSLAL